MANIEITAEELKKKNNIKLDKAKEFSNSNFWYYTSMRTLDLILDSGTIWVSNIATMNDINEANLHSNDKSKVFALCFCNSNSEKIPMWYIYSGICAKGMRMGLTPLFMLKFIESIKEIYPIIDNCKSDDKLKIGDDFLVEYGWVFYKKYFGCVNYKRRWYDISDYKEFEKDNYFIKDYPWEYEKEFRILFKLKRECNFNKIAVKIPENILTALKLSYAPEADISEDILSLNGFKKYLEKKIKKSELSIKMDLLNRNKEDILKNMNLIIDEDNYSTVCSIIKSQKNCNIK